MKKLVILAVLAMMVFAPQVYAEMNIGANIETNTTFSGASDGSDTTNFETAGRVEITATAKTENDNGMFAQATGCFDVQMNGYGGDCDVWFAIGNPSFTLKVGHFQGEEMLTAGQDTYVAGTGASQWYGMDKSRGRDPDGFGLTMKMGDAMTLDTKVSFDNNGTRNQMGVRPVLIMSAGNLKLKAGGEYYLEKPYDSDADDETSWFGAGANLTITMGNITLGGSGAYGKWDDTAVVVDDTTGVSSKVDTDDSVMSGKGYATIAMGDNSLGLGAGYTMENDADTNEVYGFVSYAMALPVEGAKVTFAGSFASGDNGAGDQPTAFGGRVRFNYDF